MDIEFTYVYLLVVIKEKKKKIIRYQNEKKGINVLTPISS